MNIDLLSLLRLYNLLDLVSEYLVKIGFIVLYINIDNIIIVVIIGYSWVICIVIIVSNLIDILFWGRSVKFKYFLMFGCELIIWVLDIVFNILLFLWVII